MTYSRNIGIGLFNLFEEDGFVKWFITIESTKTAYLIKTLTEKEKQKNKKLYKFIVLNYEDIKNPKFKMEYFDTNLELLGFIIKYEACNEEYKRHIKINKVLRKNEKN